MVVDPYAAVSAAISLATERVVFVSAYVKNDVSLALFSSLSPSGPTNRRLYVRWQKRDLLSGASDLRVFESAKEHGFSLYVYPNLHAKVYVVDKTVILGSANLTASGFGLRGAGSNFELVIRTVTDGAFEEWLCFLHRQSVKLN